MYTVWKSRFPALQPLCQFQRHLKGHPPHLSALFPTFGPSRLFARSHLELPDNLFGSHDRFSIHEKSARSFLTRNSRSACAIPSSAKIIRRAGVWLNRTVCLIGYSLGHPTTTRSRFSPKTTPTYRGSTFRKVIGNKSSTLLSLFSLFIFGFVLTRESTSLPS